MPQIDSIKLLSRLFALEHWSLVNYLTDAAPWTHSGDERATTALAHVVADQRAMAGRIAELIDARGGRRPSGCYAMDFAELNMLSLDYLLRELVNLQKRNLATIEQIVAALAQDREGRELAEEVLGSERAHLEVFEELVAQVA